MNAGGLGSRGDSPGTPGTNLPKHESTDWQLCADVGESVVNDDFDFEGGMVGKTIGGCGGIVAEGAG